MSKAAAEQTSGAPTLWTHLASRFVEWIGFPLLGRPAHGSLTVVLPNGRTRTLGNPASGLHSVLKLNNFKVIGAAMRRGTLGFASAYIDGDIEIEVVGLRPGEKLFEELLIGNDPTATAHPRIMMASETFLPWTMLGPRLALLTELLDRQDAASVRTLIAELVPEYRAGKLNDWISAACQAFDRGVVSLGAHRGKQPRLASAARKPTPAIS